MFSLLPAHKATEDTEDDEAPASNDDNEGEPIEAPITGLKDTKLTNLGINNIPYILIRVVCGIVLPLMQGQDKLGAGDQAQGGGGQGQYVVPADDGRRYQILIFIIFTYRVRQEN